MSKTKNLIIPNVTSSKSQIMNGTLSNWNATYRIVEVPVAKNKLTNATDREAK